jgi:hypothetical protein
MIKLKRSNIETSVRIFMMVLDIVKTYDHKNAFSLFKVAQIEYIIKFSFKFSKIFFLFNNPMHIYFTLINLKSVLVINIFIDIIIMKNLC